MSAATTHHSDHGHAHIHDLAIIGAGLSGIDLSHHVSATFPDWDWIALDSNTDIGGTWNTFRYPGIRSDSDMATFSFPFKPWPHAGTLGNGKDIRDYAKDAARETGLLDRLNLSTWVQRAEFHSDRGHWELRVLRATTPGTDMSEGGAAAEPQPHAEGGSPENTTSDTTTGSVEEAIWTRRVHFATGYFRHRSGYTADIPGLENFRGDLIHPQRWPEALDVRGKDVVIIGSGATAVTLLPALHSMGARATMLQRTPSYIAPLPETDMISAAANLVLPSDRARAVARQIHIYRDMAQYWACQGMPTVARGVFWLLNRQFLSGSYLREHFTPPYNPWDQRVCKAPGGDIFRAIQDGAQVVTGQIETVDATGITLRDGRHLDADILVTATGLELQAFGSAEIAVDGHVLPIPSLVSYRGLMLSGLPNLSFTIGYLNQSWTLRADMTSRYLVRLWKRLEDQGVHWAAPLLPEDARGDLPLLEMESGYIQRSVHLLPRQGDADPWRMKQDYVYESRRLLSSDDDADMVYGDSAIDAARSLTSAANADSVASP